jgi:DNA topoisomerase-3
MPKRNRFRKKIKNRPRFSTIKVTDHHDYSNGDSAICNTISSKYMIVLQRFIAFYDDCLVANTTVVGKAADILFKTTGKEILKKDFV